MSEDNEIELSVHRGFRLDEWLVQPDLGRISRGEEVVHLRPQLMDLLVYLAQGAGGLASKNDILDGVWPEEFVAESALTRCIAELRQALGDEAQEPRYIETVPKRGYRLLVEAVPVSGAADALQPSTRSTARRWLLVAADTAVVFAAVVGILYLRMAEEPAEPVRLVVLPFEHLGPPDDAWFADGMTSELISRLGVVTELEVISYTSSMYYKGTNRLIGDIGRELDVDYALEGEVRWEGTANGPSRVRITPQLIVIADDRLLWNDVYDRDLESIFDVQSDIARQVIAKVRVTLLKPEREALEARPTDNMEAYQAYLRGRAYSESFDPDELKLAVRMLERAVELDPEFALAHAALSSSYALAGVRRPGLFPDVLEKIRRAADRALEIDPRLPEGHLALGVLHWGLGEYDQALEESGIAARFRPNDANVLAFNALVHRTQGRWHESLIASERAVRLDPRNYEALLSLAEAHRWLRRHREAADTIDRAIAVAPDQLKAFIYKHFTYLGWYGYSSQSRQVLEETPARFPAPWGWFLQEFGERNYEAALEWIDRAPGPPLWRPDSVSPKSFWKCLCYRAMNRPEQARQACEAATATLEATAVKWPEAPGVRSSLGWAYAMLGRKGDAIREGERAVALMPVSKNAIAEFHLARDLAIIKANVGEADAALDLIDHLLSIPGDLTVAMLHTDPTWDPLRDHPRFEEILEKYGEEQ
jgi:TolB-like protein/DNA-binding winged helix-turn-helix (wHTH) protein